MFATLFNNLLPRHKIDFARGENSVCVLSTGDSASIKYILEPYLRNLGLSVQYIASRPQPSFQNSFNCSLLVIARYIDSAWQPALQRFRKDGGRIIYFMDDDLLDPTVTKSLPKHYAKKIWDLAASKREFLEKNCQEFWVSSPYLARKYAHLNIKLLELRPPVEIFSRHPSVTVCYHGTASHVEELAWLPPIISAVNASREEVHFEIFGDHQINKKYRNISRVSVIHPMSWQNYLAYTASVRRDIALAPLLPHPFNKGRGATKFFDFVRMGAVGIYSNVSPYRDFVRDGVDGILLPNCSSAWISAIIELSRDSERRNAMANAARERAVELAGRDV